MGAESLGSRAIIGEFYRVLAQNEGLVWVPGVSMRFTSNQESETYKWLGMSPMMREWLGGRLAKGFREGGVTVTNKHFEATMEVLRSELRRDKTGQIRVRISEMARRTNAHWAKLISEHIVAGEADTLGLAYDGQYFFDTDHSEGDSGTQSNDITYDVATATAPTTAEAEKAVLAGVQAIQGFLDDQGEPMNEDASSFLIMVPPAFFAAFAGALNNPIIVDGSGARTNTITNLGGFSFTLAANPRLSWTTKFAVFRTDANTKAFIAQEEEPVRIEAIAEGSEEEFRNDRHLYGVSAWRNVGFGFWQDAVLVTLT
jgi:phage major head subunit gpT-like protein